jgi:hypothetical protein
MNAPLPLRLKIDPMQATLPSSEIFDSIHGPSDRLERTFGGRQHFSHGFVQEMKVDVVCRLLFRFHGYLNLYLSMFCFRTFRAHFYTTATADDEELAAFWKLLGVE